MTSTAPLEATASAVRRGATRSARTRAAIADALLDLLADGNLRPTAREIARRAGVSLRSVYVHFEDRDDLFHTAAERHFARVLPVLEPVPATGTLPTRVRAMVRARSRIYDETEGVRRAAALQAPFSPALQRLGASIRHRATADTARVFARELGALPSTRRSRTHAAVDAVLSPQTWDLMRQEHGLSPADARRAMSDSLLAVLRGRQA